jgi:hypothetical protein
MDGPAEITQRPVPPGGTFTYEFAARQAGTYFYHSHDHSDRQQGLPRHLPADQRTFHEIGFRCENDTPGRRIDRG